MTVAELQLGMFVADLDRPWLETPFLVQGFTINHPREIETLRELCKFVYVDTGASRPVARDAYAGAGNTIKRQALKKMFPGRSLATYQDTHGFEDELVKARSVYDDYERMVVSIYDGYSRNRSLDLSAVGKTIDSVVGSIMRNPDACMLLTELRRKDNYTYNHAIGTSIWAAAMGRQLGLPIPEIKTLATGMLLSDIGKLNISSRVLNKKGNLSESEVGIVRQHVAEGLEILGGTSGIQKPIIEIVAHHHERHNGRGYPDGLSGDEIPVFGRIAGIIDCYDAMINERPYALAVTPADAIAKLYTMRDVDFQSELVEEFIQTIGIYPAGSLVELTNGEVGVVVAEHRKRRLRPKILLILDHEKQMLQETRYLNLLEVTHDDRGRQLDILKGIEPGKYGIKPDDLFM